MSNEGLVKSYTASATINPRRVIKFGSGDRIAAQASANTDRFAGVAVLPVGTTCASGEPFDVAKSGIVDIDYGGTITRGDRLTCDSDGKAISAEAVSGSKRAVVNGGSAGNITVTGILTTDRLIAVLYYPISTGTVTSVSDLTSEFTISAADTINNTGGTATTGGKLLVIYERALSIIGTAEVSGVSGDIGKVMINTRR
jgi:hypothetical protein